jgi:N4-gp56 family major capsid protein
MTDVTLPTALVAEQWDDKFFVEYIQEGPFKALMGTDEQSVVQVKEQLGKGEGDAITFALINRLTNAAVTGVSVLEGNEVDMKERSFRMTIEKYRNAVRLPEMTEWKTPMDMRNAARSVLMTWAQEHTRDLFINGLGELNGTAFIDRTAAIADAWLVDNLDRVHFGAGVGSGTDLSADLTQLDTTNDLFNATALDAMVYKAKTCNPKIRPMRDPGNGKRYYIAFAHPAAFANLRTSITTTLGNTVVEPQGAKLFEGGDILWNGVIVKEVDNIPVYENLGNGGTAEVTPVYLCGAQAMAIAFGRRWKTVTEVFDYGDKYGVAVDGIYGVKKIIYGSGSGDTDDLKDHGVVTGFFATTALPTVAAAAAAEN